MTMCTAPKKLFVFGPLAIAAAMSLSCKGVNTPQAGTDVMVAVKDVICLIDTYSTEVQGGVNAAQAAIDAASKCGIASDIASTVLASHVAGMEREARKFSPDSGQLVDAGAPVLVKKASK
jgi:hypothetical protein